MDLLGMLRSLGDRLGIIEMTADPAQPAAPMKIQTRTVTLTELMAIHLKEVRELAEQPAELPVSFDDIFKAAGIVTPQGGWTVDRLREFLGSEDVRAMGREQAQQHTLRALASEKVDAAEIVKDAILRDQALDAFAEFTLKKRGSWLDEKEQELLRLKDRQRELEHKIAAEEKKWSEFRARKREREREMARAVEYLIDKPVISIDEE